jgi:hypothetical protein
MKQASYIEPAIDSVREMLKEFKRLAPVEADVREMDEFQRRKQQIYQHSLDQDVFERFVNANHYCVIFLLLYIHGLIVFLIKIKASPVPIGNSSALASRVTANEFPIPIETSYQYLCYSSDVHRT